MRRCAQFLAATALGALAGCGPLADSRSAGVDLRPPLVQAVQTVGPDEIGIEFDEEATLVPEKTRITPPLAVAGVTAEGKQVLVRGAKQVPGLHYALEAEARDARGNSASFLVDFYGYNPQVPRVLINELTPRGSGSHPDLVELKALTAGNMGGVVLYLGGPDSYDNRLVFPSLSVAAGSFILVHCKPAGDPAEVNECKDMAESGGQDASGKAWDFWLEEAKGLGGNNGVVSLYERPGGACMDGILYSNRTSQSDEAYRGFGSADMLARAEKLASDGGWKPSGPRVSPEDAVNPEGSTSTRSICRSSVSADTDAAEDWHIVPTRKASFGADNSDEMYRP
jgi:hypothetical protein